MKLTYGICIIYCTIDINHYIDKIYTSHKCKWMENTIVNVNLIVLVPLLQSLVKFYLIFIC